MEINPPISIKIVHDYGPKLSIEMLGQTSDINPVMLSGKFELIMHLLGLTPY